MTPSGYCSFWPARAICRSRSGIDKICLPEAKFEQVVVLAVPNTYPFEMQWWTRSRTLKAALAFTVLYFAIAGYLKYTYVPQPDGQKRFRRLGNFSYLLPAAEIDELADSLDDPTRSPIMLYEDGLALGPPHSVHIEIRTIGHGRFSHWKKMGIIFSSSDNSNPNENGRSYSFSKP